MNDHGLRHVVAGFAHESFGSQAVFRAALDALSHPGRPFELPLDTALPRHGHGAAAALALRGESLRRHTGAARNHAPHQAELTMPLKAGDILFDHRQPGASRAAIARRSCSPASATSSSTATRTPRATDPTSRFPPRCSPPGIARPHPRPARARSFSNSARRNSPSGR